MFVSTFLTQLFHLSRENPSPLSHWHAVFSVIATVILPKCKYTQLISVTCIVGRISAHSPKTYDFPGLRTGSHMEMEPCKCIQENTKLCWISVGPNSLWRYPCHEIRKHREAWLQEGKQPGTAI